MELAELFQRFGIALGLGLLVGLQRERAGSRLAGIRTFPRVTVLGGLCALLGEKFGGWLVGLGLGRVIVRDDWPLIAYSPASRCDYRQTFGPDGARF